MNPYRGRIKSWCFRCAYKTNHALVPDAPCGDVGLWWRCARCHNSTELSAYAASLCERVD